MPPALFRRSAGVGGPDHGRPLSIIFNFYCGYNRSIVDQACRGEFEFLDAIMFGDHCVQLLGTADSVRMHMPKRRILFNPAHRLDQRPGGRCGRRRRLSAALVRAGGLCRPADRGRGGARLHPAVQPEPRPAARALRHAPRRPASPCGPRRSSTSSSRSMVMDKAEHTALLEQLTQHGLSPGPQRVCVRLHLSGHFCHAPKPGVLDLIEECGAIVVDDDLYTASATSRRTCRRGAPRSTPWRSGT